MLAILSPARNCKPVTAPGTALTRPAFMPQTTQLVAHLRAYSPWQLESLLDVPPERALHLYNCYAGFDAAAPGSPALLSYYGQAYRNMNPQDFSPGELAFAQDTLRIFSALYGMLRPCDGILDHRLGLKKQFSPGGQSLHQFWGSALYKTLFAEGCTVINLASEEYAKLVTPYLQPGDEMLTCRFLVDKPGGPRGTVSTVRAARGLMTRFIVKNRIQSPAQLAAFDADGYQFAPARSTAREYVFIKRRRYMPGGEALPEGLLLP